MGKFTHGQLGIEDLEPAMRFIGACHDGALSLIISPSGTGATGGWHTSMKFTGDALPGTEQLRMLSVDGRWPGSEGTTFVGHCLSAAYQLDWLLCQDLGKLLKEAE